MDVISLEIEGKGEKPGDIVSYYEMLSKAFLTLELRSDGRVGVCPPPVFPVLPLL